MTAIKPIGSQSGKPSPPEDPEPPVLVGGGVVVGRGVGVGADVGADVGAGVGVGFAAGATTATFAEA
jgi:hypothetical protein